jgi:glycosyltransferase involved in cell wall biosynthesis
MRVIQVLCAAGPVDAVTNQALAYRTLFERWGWSGEDFAPVQAEGMARGVIRPLHELRRSPDDVLVLHYSGYATGIERVLGAGGRTLVVSHNITPPEFFWASDPVEAVRCQLARGQLAELADAAGVLAGVSAYNAAELQAISGRSAEVIPVLFDRRRLGTPGGMNGRVVPAPTVLFVGRLVPHKRQDLAIRAFARFRSVSPGARLVLVGTPLSPDYARALVSLAGALAPGAVTFSAGLSPAQLWDHYRSAGVFLCLSEHEGFCIPLLEAFHFGVPVIARDAGAVSEVVGDAAVLVDSSDDIATVAELLPIVLGDPELRDELARRGQRRLEEFDYDATASRLRDTLQRLATS